MNILGLHFGHDGAICIIKQGKIAAYVSRERESRVKHAIGITTHELEKALALADLSFDAIDYCAVTSTQSIELLTGNIDDFHIEFAKHPSDPFPQPLYETLQQEKQPIADRLNTSLQQIFQKAESDQLQYRTYSKICLEKRK